MTIGARIKQKRIELGITVDDLAQMLGKNRATVYRYESDDIENMRIDVLEPLAKALNTTPAYLMGWEEEPSETEEARVEAMLQELKDNPQLGVLLSSTKDLNEKDLEMVIEMVKRLRESYRE